MEIDDELFDKLMGIYFRQNYVGFGENSEEDLDFIKDNTFKVIITKETLRNGYESDGEIIYKHKLTLNTPYTLNSMNVGRSHSTLTLKEFPGIDFNTVNFKFLKLKNA